MRFKFIKKQNIKGIFNKRGVKVGIAFGGGGARGFAHLGAIKAFEEYGIKFDYVSGTSAGSLIGAFYAAGLTFKQMFEIAKNIDASDIRTNKIPLMPSKTDAIQEVITKNLGDINIEDLSLSYSAIAVDIKTTEEVVITKGNLAKAVAGSCCVPGIFVPVEFDNHLLCDGGLQNTIPANVPKLFGCDYVVGIDVNKSRAYGTTSSKMLDVIGCTIRILMKGNALRGYLNADVMVAPETKRFKSTKSEGFLDMIDEGYKDTIDKMPEILALFNKRKPKTKQREEFKPEYKII